MVLIRNPWGKQEWRGRFSRHNLESWTEDVQSALGVSGPDPRRGVFWMEVDDVFEHFEGVNVYMERFGA